MKCLHYIVWWVDVQGMGTSAGVEMKYPGCMWHPLAAAIPKNSVLFLPLEYMNQNGSAVASDVANPIYQHPARPALDETEEEYLNCFRNPVTITCPSLAPEYLNTSHTQIFSPLTSSQKQPNGHGYIAQNSIDNPDYQQDFFPAGTKTKPNGHLPATENSEYMGVEVH